MSTIGRKSYGRNSQGKLTLIPFPDTFSGFGRQWVQGPVPAPLFEMPVNRSRRQ